MTHEQFCYWLQGFSELQGRAPTEKQWNMIVDHLNTTFVKVTPNYSDLLTKVRDGTFPTTTFPLVQPATCSATC